MTNEITAESHESLSESTETPGENMPGSRLALFTWRGILAFFVVLGVGALTGQGQLSLLCAFIIAIGLVGRTWAGLSLLALHCHRTLDPLRAFPGEVLSLKVTLDNRKPLPLGWVRVDQNIPYAIAPADRSLEPTITPSEGRFGFSTSLGWYRAVSWTCRLECRIRGCYTIGPPRVLSGDIFGLFLKSRHTGADMSVIVYPRLIDMEQIGLPSRHPLGDMEDPSRLFEDPAQPLGLREYTADTPFKNIAWTASARHGQLYAKIFAPTVTLRTAIFLAVDSFSTARSSEAFELGISVCASLAERLLGDRQPVGMYANGLQVGRPGMIAIAPGRGEDHLTGILEGLARLCPEAIVPFSEFLETGAWDLPARMTLCIVATRLSTKEVDALMALRRRGYAVTALIIGDGPMPEGRIPYRRVGVSLPNASAGGRR